MGAGLLHGPKTIPPNRSHHGPVVGPANLDQGGAPPLLYAPPVVETDRFGWMGRTHGHGIRKG